MAKWITPIFDRTQTDVDIAIQKITEWITATISGYSHDVYDLKGCLNVSDINRIEENIGYLAELLNDYGYFPDVSVRTWENADIPTENDIKRIVHNVSELVESFRQHSDAPTIPSSLMRYDDVNAIEKNLYLMKKLINIMEDSFKKSGTFQSGSTMFLPIRR